MHIELKSVGLPLIHALSSDAYELAIFYRDSNLSIFKSLAILSSDDIHLVDNPQIKMYSRGSNLLIKWLDD